MYIDPNTGGLLAQVLVGAFVAASGFILIFSRKIKEGVAKMRRRSREENEETQE